MHNTLKTNLGIAEATKNYTDKKDISRCFCKNHIPFVKTKLLFALRLLGITVSADHLHTVSTDLLYIYIPRLMQPRILCNLVQCNSLFQCNKPYNTSDAKKYEIIQNIC